MTILRLIAIAALGLAATLCAADTVTVYMYSEYIDPEIPKAFTAATGTEVVIDTYENQDEMLGKLQSGALAQYDVLVATDVIVPQMIRLGLVQKLDGSKIPNGKNVDAKFRDPAYDKGNAYSWPYQWGTVGLMYRTDVVKGEPSWAQLLDPGRQPGPFVLMDEMRSTMAMALQYQGKSTNSKDPTEIKAAGELLLKAKKSPKFLGFEGGVGGMNKVLAGEAAMAVVYNGDAVKNLPEDGSCSFAVPKEGSGIWCDVMLLSAKAPNAKAAHAFINHILDAKVGAQLSNFNHYATPNAAAMPFIVAKDRSNPSIYPTPEIMAKLEFQEDVGDAVKAYDEAWTAVKSR
jgi:spermidine/putrescine transport system substrate-binding protein